MMLLTMDSDSLESSANFKFCKDLLNWVFQESGVLRASNLRHNKKNERCTESDQSLCSANPENYMIEDNVEFYIDLEQKTEGKWAPFIANDV
jgi:oligosaccharyltransferase complex subunit beta